jgi:Palmitoyl protein thioesterase
VPLSSDEESYLARWTASRRQPVPQVQSTMGIKSVRRSQETPESQSIQNVSRISIEVTGKVIADRCRIFQKSLAPASYWHDVNEDRYKRGSTFLAVVNNENDYNEAYVRNLQSLRRLVLVKYVEDKSLIPNESAWFGYNFNGTSLALEDMEVFKKDRLGLVKLKAEGKLSRLESPHEHLVLNKKWFRANITPILKEKN